MKTFGTPYWVMYMDQTSDTPAGGGGETPPVPSSDVDWMAESDPSTEDSPAPVTPATPKASEPAPLPPNEKVASPVAPTSPAAPAAPAPSAPVATPAPAAPVVPQAPVAAAPVAPTAPVAPVAPVQPTPPVAEPQPAAHDLAALRSAEVSRLTSVLQSRMPEDVARGLLVEPEKYLPTILANIQVDTMDAVIQHMYASLPGLIQNLSQQTNAAQENERAFFTAWPALNDPLHPEYKRTVENAIRSYRQLNPQASRDEVIRAAGLTSMITHRLPLPQELFAPPPVAPVAPAQPFQHAAPNAAAPAAPVPGTTNAFTLLNEEYDREERG